MAENSDTASLEQRLEGIIKEEGQKIASKYPQPTPENQQEILQAVQSELARSPRIRKELSAPVPAKLVSGAVAAASAYKIGSFYSSLGFVSSIASYLGAAAPFFGYGLAAAIPGIAVYNLGKSLMNGRKKKVFRNVMEKLSKPAPDAGYG